MGHAHLWSGWPNAYCKKCRQVDLLEMAVLHGAYDPWLGRWSSPEAREKYRQSPCRISDEEYQAGLAELQQNTLS